MKKNNKRFSIRGFLADFWMLPIALLIMFWHNRLPQEITIFPTMNPVKIGNLVPTLVVWLIVLFLVRTYTFFQYLDVYHDGLMSKRNERWESLPPSQQFWLLRLERWVLIIALAIIYSAMM